MAKLTIMARIRWAIIGLAVLGAAAGSGYYAARRAAKAAEAEALRLAEAALAHEQGLRAAAEESARGLENKVAANEGLARELAILEDQLASIGAKDPEVIETIKWKTKEILVNPDDLLGPIDQCAPVDSEENGEASPPAESPRLGFRIAGAQAKIKTEKGNFFAVGTAKLYRSTPEPEIELGEAPFQHELTALDILKTVKPPPARRWALGFKATRGDFQGEGIWVTRDLARVRLIGEASHLTASVPDFGSESGFVYEVGAGWKF